MTPELLPDRWHSRDFPVLIAAARLIDAGHGHLNAGTLAGLADIEHDTIEVKQALGALVPRYLVAMETKTKANGQRDWIIVGVTEDARRATGLWPREDAAADALVELLEQAASTTEDPDDAGNLRKAGRLLRSVPGAVVADVTAALIRQQSGL